MLKTGIHRTCIFGTDSPCQGRAPPSPTRVGAALRACGCPGGCGAPRLPADVLPPHGGAAATRDRRRGDPRPERRTERGGAGRRHRRITGWAAVAGSGSDRRAGGHHRHPRAVLPAERGGPRWRRASQRHTCTKGGFLNGVRSSSPAMLFQDDGTPPRIAGCACLPPVQPPRRASEAAPETESSATRRSQRARALDSRVATGLCTPAP